MIIRYECPMCEGERVMRVVSSDRKTGRSVTMTCTVCCGHGVLRVVE